jgi:hypothetical protein
MNIFLFLPLFILAAFLAFYIPGRVILGRQKNLSKVGILAVSFILGIVLWGWQGYIFGFLHVYILSYAYLLVFLLIFLKKKYYSFSFPSVKLNKIDWLTILMAGVGIFGQVIPNVRTGQITSLGLFISPLNNPDHVWHVSLVEEFLKRFPPNEPGMFGIPLVNYHFWFNMVTADIIRVFHLPIFQTQFIGMYGIASVLLALISYSFASSILKSKLFLRIFLFFTFFSGNLIALFIFLIKNKLPSVLISGFEDATKFIDAPGRGFAIIISLAALYILYKNRGKISWKNVFIVGLLFGSLIGFKVYFGLPFIFGLFCLAIFDLLKKNFSSLCIFGVAVIFSLAQFIPFNLTSGGLAFMPFEIPKSFMLGIGININRIINWDINLADHNYLPFALSGILISIVYLVVQFGIKSFGFIFFKKTLKILGSGFSVLLYSTIFSSLVLGLFFYQKIGGANIWEFFMTASLILTITISLNACLFLSKLKKIPMFIFLTLIILLTVPSWAQSTYYNLSLNFFSGFHGISNPELKSYEYLKNNTPKDSMILLIDQKKYVQYSSIANVLTERNLYLSGEGVSQVKTPEIQKREEEVKIVNYREYPGESDPFLRREINYVYIYANTDGMMPSAGKNSTLHLVFSNDSAKIYKVGN